MGLSVEDTGMDTKISLSKSIIHKMSRASNKTRAYFEGVNTNNYLDTIYVLRYYGEFVGSFGAVDRPSALDGGHDTKIRVDAISKVFWNLIDLDTKVGEIDVDSLISSIRFTPFEEDGEGIEQSAKHYLEEKVDYEQALHQLELRTRYMLFAVAISGNLGTLSDVDRSMRISSIFPEFNSPIIFLKKEQVWNPK